MDRNNKVYSFDIISIILTFLLIFTKIKCDKIPLINLSAGDVISGVDLNDATSVIVGKLFDDNIKSKYVEKNILDYSRNQGYTTMYYCNETDHSNFYPNIIVCNATNKIVNKNNQLNGSILGIDEGYVNRKYLCVAFKTCDVKIEETVSNDLMKENDLPEEVKLAADKMGVSTMRRERETYYVSAILKGYCVYQVRSYYF